MELNNINTNEGMNLQFYNNQFTKSCLKILIYILVTLIPIILPVVIVKIVGDGAYINNLCASSGDSAFWWLQADSLVNYGGIHGYYGANGSHAPIQGFYTWGAAPLFPYYIFGKIYGWKLCSMTVANIVMLSMSLLLFLCLSKATIKESIIIGVLYLSAFYTVGYSMYSTAEGERYALGIMLAGIVIFAFRSDLYYLSEKPLKRTEIVLAIALLIMVFFSSVVFLPFIIVVPLLLFSFFRKLNIMKKILYSTTIFAIFSLVAYYGLYIFSAPYLSGSKFEKASLGQVIRQLVTRFVNNFESINLYNVVKYDSKPLFWFFIIYLIITVVVIYNFVCCRNLSTFIPLYYVLGFLLGICALYNGEPNTVARLINVGLMMSILSECILMNNAFGSSKREIQLVLIFIIVNFLAINGAWKMYNSACAEGSGTYEISDTLKSERAKFDDATDISDQFDRFDNTIAYYGLLDRMCLSLPGGAGINYMYNMQVDDRMKYAVIRTESFDYSELLTNLEEAYDVVFQDDYFVLMERQ